MYEAKYSRYITKNITRFAEDGEVMDKCKKIDKSKNEYPAGVPLFYNKYGAAYVDDEDNHTAIIGPSGCKKTRCTVIPTINSVIDAGESAIINDPKGELYQATAQRAEMKKAKVSVLNFRKFNNDSWNPLKPIMDYYRAGNTRIAYQLINDFVEQITSLNLENTNDRYWADESRMLLTAIILILLDSTKNNPSWFSLSTIIQLVNEKYNEKFLALYHSMREECTASMCLSSVLFMPEKTRTCIIGTLMSCLEPFSKNPELLNMLSGDSVDITKLAKEQTIIYLIYPDEKPTFNFIINSFLTQSYELLAETASNSANDRLKIRVNYILDEFSNLPKITSFENRISESRSKNIRYFLCLQSLNQLTEKYEKNAETIISNCNNWICYSTKEMDFLDKIADLCGKEADYNGNEHYLLSPFEMQHLKKEQDYVQVVLIKQGLYPYVSELLDYEYIPGTSYQKKKLMPTRLYDLNESSITAEKWFEYIIDGTLPIPFPKHS